MKRKILFSILILSLLWPVCLFAETAPSSLYRWSTPSPDAQMQADTTSIPAGQGAIFVPAMSTAADEPLVLLFAEGQQVLSGATGQRLVVAPGNYRVRVGSGAIELMHETEVKVQAGSTAIVHPKWGALRIEVVDEGNIPHRGTYELIRVEDREVIGTGYGADTLQAESLRTWLLTPGLYRVVRPGETYRARKNFATVDIPEGGLVHFKLVTEPSTGEFRGAGVVDAEELVVAEGGASDSRWTKRVLLGGAVSLNSTDQVVGQTNQDVLSGTVFFDTYLTYRDGKHFGTGIFEIEEGLVRVDPANGRSLPTQKAQDRLRADVAYTYFFKKNLGVYGRFGLQTNLFASDVLVTEDTTVAFNRLNGSRDVLFVPANGEYRTADSFGSLRIREGVGLNVRLLRSRRATVNWRFGAGLRQNLVDGSFIQLDDPTTPALDLFEIDNFSEEGLETTLTATVHLGRSLLYLTDLEVFGDFGDLGDPTIDWRNTLSYRLTNYASLDYRLDLLRIPQIVDEDQITQNLLLRFSLNIL